MAPNHASLAVTQVKKCRWNTGKRELGMELRNHPFQESALLLDGIDKRNQADLTRTDFSWRSRRPQASVDALCSRTGRARSVPVDVIGRQGKVCDLNPCMYARGKSDIGIVPKNLSNKASQRAAETKEARTDDQEES